MTVNHSEAPSPQLPADLNERQRAAVLHGRAPLLVVAGAGTGKTATLAYRVAHMMHAGIHPGRILLLTFTRRAAAEMLRRVDGILRASRPGGATGDLDAQSRVWGGTFHAVATRLLRLHGRAIGLDPSFTILDRSDAEDLLGVLRTELGLSRNDRRFPLKSTCMDIYSRCVNACRPVDETVRASFPWCGDDVEDLRRLFAAYVDRKEEQRVLDYDDLLLFWHGLLRSPEASAAVRSRFECVLVDEYQDTNLLQADILEMLCPAGVGLTVVGDDAQAIYSFRAATVRNILEFPTRFPGTEIVTLEQNYRSTQPLLDATNGLISLSKERYVKNLWTDRKGGARPTLVGCDDEDEQSQSVVRHVLEHREEGILLRRQAVLFRASYHSLALELELARRNVPFRKYGGLRFMETAHVKDLLAFLRLAENPRDVMAGTRVLMLLPGVGPKKAHRLMHHLVGGHGRSGGVEFDERHSRAHRTAGSRGKAATRPAFDSWSNLPPPSAAAEDYWSPFHNLMTAIGGKDPGDLPSQINRVRHFYAPLLERLYDNSRARMMDLKQLEQLSARFSDRGRFLAEMVLDSPTYSEDLAGPPLLDDDYLVLSTIHSAKGLEWDAVHIIHAADGCIPSDMSTGSSDEIEEELRLFYVALTRAKDRLYVYWPLRYYTHPRTFSDVHGYAQLTRFLPESVRSLFDEVQAVVRSNPAYSDRESIEDTGNAQVVTTEDIRKRLKESL